MNAITGIKYSWRHRVGIYFQSRTSLYELQPLDIDIGIHVQRTKMFDCPSDFSDIADLMGDYILKFRA